MKIEPHKSAIHRTKPSHSARTIEQRGLVKNHVFDYGCGTGTDAEYLKSKGYNVSFWDPYFHNEKLPSEYPLHSFHTILCTYILNVIQKDDRIEVIAKIRKLLHPEGSVFFTVRTDFEIAYQVKRSNWIKNNDGWISKRGTFQKGFKSDELELLLKNEGFKNVYTICKNPLIIQCSGAN